MFDSQRVKRVARHYGKCCPSQRTIENSLRVGESEGKLLSEETWGVPTHREQTIEGEFLTQHGLDSNLANDVHVLFKESLFDALPKVLGESGAMTLAKLMDDTCFDDPLEVFATLDSIFYSGSEIIKTAITNEFRRNVGQLIEKAKLTSAAPFARSNRSNLPTDSPESPRLSRK